MVLFSVCIENRKVTTGNALNYLGMRGEGRIREGDTLHVHREP